MSRLALSRIALVLAPILIAALVLEFTARRFVPRNGTTPFRTPTVDALIHELRPNFTTLYKGVVVSINADGLRGPEVPARKAGVPRVMLVGDSVAFGQAVLFEDALAVRLEVALRSRGVEAHVLCGGVPGYAARDVAVFTEHRVARLAPDLLVYVFGPDDVRTPWVPTEIPPDAVIDAFHDFPFRSAFMQWAGVRARGVLRGLGGSEPGTWVSEILSALDDGGRDRLRDALVRLKQVARDTGATLVVAAFPFLTAPSADPFGPVERACRELSDELMIPFVDLGAAFGDDEDLTRLWANPFDAHPNRDANERAANCLADALLDGGLITR